MFSGDMAERWTELHGSNHWDGQLDPLDMIMATYEAFIAERRSNVSHPGWYAVTRYIYATASADVHGKVLLRPLCRNGRARECNWMGYVAVAYGRATALQASGHRRGVARHAAGAGWVADLKLAFASAAGILGAEGADRSEPSVHRRYLSLYTSVDEGSELSKRKRQDAKDCKADGQIQGRADEHHCGRPDLGATLATLNAVDIAANYYNKSALCTAERRAPVTAVVFGSPRTGDRDFRDMFHHLPRSPDAPCPEPAGPHPLYPPVGYADVGVELLIDTRRSPFLKPHGNESQSHDLGATCTASPGGRGALGVRAGGRPGHRAGEQVR
ncbi:hypothetical protein ZWY2020_008564 [Hordeum vulgare]|nr:hypothetical protein ZWY2020_008564 [Hordeum vulgare]